MHNSNCNCGCGRGGCCGVHKTGKVLLIIGGINLGLVGLGALMNSASSWNVVNMIFGSMPTLEAIVYLLVGIAAAMQIFGCRCKRCMAGCESCNTGSMDRKM